MARPLVHNTAEVAYSGLMPWKDIDESQGWPLLALVVALTAQLGPLDDLVRDTDDYPGWSSVLDVDRASMDVLPWLGQFVGVVVNTALSEEDQRAQIRSRQGFQRGTPGAMRAAAQPYLTGTKTVMLDERFTSAYTLRVRTFTAETPDPVLVEAALRAQKPAGIVMTYEVSDGRTYDEIRDTGKTYDQLSAEFLTSDAMKTAQTI